MPAARGEVCDPMSCLSMSATLSFLRSTQVVRRRGAKAAGTNDDSIRLADHDAACSGIDANDRTLSRGWSVGLFLTSNFVDSGHDGIDANDL